MHGFAAPIGGMFDAPHGAVCAALLPHVVRANIEALRSRAPESAALARYHDVADILTGSAAAGPEDAVAWLAALVRDLKPKILFQRSRSPPSATLYPLRFPGMNIVIPREFSSEKVKIYPIFYLWRNSQNNYIWQRCVLASNRTSPSAFFSYPPGRLGCNMPVILCLLALLKKPGRW